MNRGALIISLDFELLWGVFDKVDWKNKIEYFQNTRRVIPEILMLFEKYQVHCTWATVGMLFNENWEEWNQNIPKILPDYADKNLDAYKYGKSIQNKETEEFCFAPELIRRIKGAPGQEVGTHTYSHYYCLEPGQTPESFKADLQKSRELAEKFGVDLKSLVFPRNQYNSTYLEVCKDIGLQTVRTNPDVWYWENTQKDSFQQKIFRTGDAYFGINNKSYPRKEIGLTENGLQKQKASRLLRPYKANKLNNFKLKRIISEMEAAARKGEIYHLWWHPHNFGSSPNQSLNELLLILKEFKRIQNIFGFQSSNMRGFSENY